MANVSAKNDGGLSKQYQQTATVVQPTGKVSSGTKTPGGEYNQKATVIQDGDPNYYQKATVVPDEDYNQKATVIQTGNATTPAAPQNLWELAKALGGAGIGMAVTKINEATNGGVDKAVGAAATATSKARDLYDDAAAGWNALSAIGDNADPTGTAGYITDPLAEAAAKGNLPGVDTSSGLPKGSSKGDLASLHSALDTALGRKTIDRDGSSTETTPTVNPNGDLGNGGYSNYYASGSGGGSGSSGGYNGTGYSDAELLAQALKAAGITADPYQLPEIAGPNPERLQHVDTTELQNLLQQIVDTQKQQGNAQIDYGVEQGVNELTRAMEDAAVQYQTQRDQATADELRALDNQALYAEARGDRGGIGEAQYASIQNTAAQNRRAVNDAQVKLSTDTQRQISDLRSQGEFQKADQLLSITQSYLKDLMGLEQWALEANMSVDQFNSQLQQWVDEYNLNVQKFLTDLDLSASQLTGVFANGKQTAAAKQQLNESLASSGSALLSAGVLPSRQQLEAMGMTEVQAKAYIKKITAK